jgi:hypothetical protein
MQEHSISIGAQIIWLLGLNRYCNITAGVLSGVSYVVPQPRLLPTAAILNQSRSENIIKKLVIMLQRNMIMKKI